MFAIGVILFVIGIVFFSEINSKKDVKWGLTFSITGFIIMLMMCLIFQKGVIKMTLYETYCIIKHLIKLCDKCNIDPDKVPILYWNTANNQFQSVEIINDLRNETGDDDTWFTEIDLNIYN